MALAFSRENGHPIRGQTSEDDRRWSITQGGRGGDTRETEGPTTGATPRGQQGPGRRLRAAKGGQTGVGRGGRSRHAACGAETSGEGWWVVGVGEVQVDDVPRRERKWGVGVE